MRLYRRRRLRQIRSPRGRSSGTSLSIRVRSVGRRKDRRRRYVWTEKKMRIFRHVPVGYNSWCGLNSVTTLAAFDVLFPGIASFFFDSVDPYMSCNPPSTSRRSALRFVVQTPRVCQKACPFSCSEDLPLNSISNVGLAVRALSCYVRLLDKSSR